VAQRLVDKDGKKITSDDIARETDRDTLVGWMLLKDEDPSRQEENDRLRDDILARSRELYALERSKPAKSAAPRATTTTTTTTTTSATSKTAAAKRAAAPSGKKADRADDKNSGARGAQDSKAAFYGGRLQRAKARQERRARKNKVGEKRGQGHGATDIDYEEAGKSVAIATPFGVVRAEASKRKNAGGQPNIYFSKNDWPDDTLITQTNYDFLHEIIANSGQETAIFEEIQNFLNANGAVTPTKLQLSARAKMAAAALCGLLSHGESHQTRNPSGGKVERAAARHAAKSGVKKTFGRREGAYPPAWAKEAGAKIGGTEALRSIREVKRDKKGALIVPISEATEELFELLSPSSAESSVASESGEETEKPRATKPAGAAAAGAKRRAGAEAKGREKTKRQAVGQGNSPEKAKTLPGKEPRRKRAREKRERTESQTGVSSKQDGEKAGAGGATIEPFARDATFENEPELEIPRAKKRKFRRRKKTEKKNSDSDEKEGEE
jgi:hypothetical protein